MTQGSLHATPVSRPGVMPPMTPVGVLLGKYPSRPRLLPQARETHALWPPYQRLGPAATTLGQVLPSSLSPAQDTASLRHQPCAGCWARRGEPGGAGGVRLRLAAKAVFHTGVTGFLDHAVCLQKSCRHARWALHTARDPRSAAHPRTCTPPSALTPRARILLQSSFSAQNRTGGPCPLGSLASAPSPPL